MASTPQTADSRVTGPPRLPDELPGIRVHVADGLIRITLSGDVGADQVGCVAAELDAICRLGQGTLVLIFTDDTCMSTAAARALVHMCRHGELGAGRLRVYGGNDATVSALVGYGLRHSGPAKDIAPNVPRTRIASD